MRVQWMGFILQTNLFALFWLPIVAPLDRPCCSSLDSLETSFPSFLPLPPPFKPFRPSMAVSVTTSRSTVGAYILISFQVELNPICLPPLNQSGKNHNKAPPIMFVRSLIWRSYCRDQIFTNSPVVSATCTSIMSLRSGIYCKWVDSK